MYAGGLESKEDPKGYEIGRPFNLPEKDRLIGSVTQPWQNFFPVLHLRADGWSIYLSISHFKHLLEQAMKI